jgi:hypothetical protein
MKAFQDSSGSTSWAATIRLLIALGLEKASKIDGLVLRTVNENARDNAINTANEVFVEVLDAIRERLDS